MGWLNRLERYVPVMEAPAIVSIEKHCDREGAESSEFDEVFLEHYARVVGVLFRMTGDRARAEELADDVFLKLHRRPLASGREHNLRGWLYRAAIRLGIDELRSVARRQRYEADAASETARTSKSDDPLNDLLREEKRKRVRETLARLKPAQAQLLILRSSGFSYRELAEALGIKLPSVGTSLARAEAEFESRYRRMCGDEEQV